VTVGVNATVLGPVVVGDDAVIGAQALVLSDVPPTVKVRAPKGAIATVESAPRPRHVTLVGGA
jgi:serine O-acetyltransferase